MCSELLGGASAVSCKGAVCVIHLCHCWKSSKESCKYSSKMFPENSLFFLPVVVACRHSFRIVMIVDSVVVDPKSVSFWGSA